MLFSPSFNSSRQILLLRHNALQLPLRQRQPHIVNRPLLHLLLRLLRPGSHVRHEQDVVVGQQARVDLGLVLVDVEADGRDFARGEGVDEGGLVHDGAAGRVYDDDAGLHEGELGGGDGVAGAGLQKLILVTISRITYMT